MIRRRHFPARVPLLAWPLICVALLWWAPSLVLFRAGLIAHRARLEIELAAVAALAALGRRQAARDLMARVLRRTRREQLEVERRGREREP